MAADAVSIVLVWCFLPLSVLLCPPLIFPWLLPLLLLTLALLAAPSRRHHRLLLVTELSPTDLTAEVEFIHTSLIPDPKNYHTWAYLHWLYSHFSELGRITNAMWASELAWCESLIAEDGRNNSAWGWRWFLRMARPGAVGGKHSKAELE